MTKTSTRHTLSHRADDLESETAARRRNVKIIAPLVPPALKHLFVGSDIRKSDSHRISCLRATGILFNRAGENGTEHRQKEYIGS